MTYPADVEQKLGFDQLRSRLAAYCRSGLGLRELGRIVFSADFVRIQTLLHQTVEFKTMLEDGEPVPDGEFFDPDALLQTIAIEDSFVEAEDLTGICRSLLLAVGYRAFLSTNADRFPYLARLADPVRVPRNRCGTDHVEVRRGGRHPRQRKSGTRDRAKSAERGTTPGTTVD